MHLSMDGQERTSGELSIVGRGCRLSLVTGGVMSLSKSSQGDQMNLGSTVQSSIETYTPSD